MKHTHPWQKSEDRAARDLGLRRVSGSGNQPGKKGDCEDDTVLLENKYSAKGEYRLSYRELVRIYTQGMVTGRRPLFRLELPQGAWLMEPRHSADSAVSGFDHDTVTWMVLKRTIKLTGDALNIYTADGNLLIIYWGDMAWKISRMVEKKKRFRSQTQK